MKSGPPTNNTRKIFHRLNELYARMESEYDALAAQIGLSCAQCADNCCVSYFQHHTYIEWAYLWEGMDTLDKDHRQVILERAEAYCEQANQSLQQGERPKQMCPLNEEGWCALYPYRLMICRLHGVPNQVRMPNGQIKKFPGCSTCQDLTSSWTRVPVLDRTPLYIQLAQLEKDFLGCNRSSLPKVDLTLAQMLVKGRPEVDVSQGE